MNKLIKIITNKEGKQLVSARELYIGLGLNKSNWSRWYPTNIINNDFFIKNIDWIGVRHYDEGNEVIDFAISIDFAKHIAMMARTEKSHEYRNYFIECENRSICSKRLSAGEMLELQFKFTKEVKEEVKELKEDFNNFKDNAPLFNVECDEIIKKIKSKATDVLGGYGSKAYKDKSIRSSIYSDIHKQLRREFQVRTYKALNRNKLQLALDIINQYNAPYVIQEQIFKYNNE